MPFSRFTGTDTAMLLIDHQKGTITFVNTMSQDELKHNTINLAKTAKIVGMPVVLTSSMEDAMQGPLIPQLAEILPEAFTARIKRGGIVNSMEDGAFGAAVKATGRKRFIVAGVTNEVCTVFPVLALLADGNEVQVVTDAGGSTTKVGDDMALWRMQQAGAILTSTATVIAELAGSWTSPEGAQIVQQVILGEIEKSRTSPS